MFVCCIYACLSHTLKHTLARLSSRWCVDYVGEDTVHQRHYCSDYLSRYVNRSDWLTAGQKA